MLTGAAVHATSLCLTSLVTKRLRSAVPYTQRFSHVGLVVVIGPLPACLFFDTESVPMSAVFNFTFVPWFRSVAPYIHTHRGKTFVVGLAGEAIAAGKLQHIAQDLALIQSMGVKIVLVHGFRPQVNEQLKAKGHQARYSHGMRITDEVALDSAQEAAGQLRYEIEAAR